MAAAHKLASYVHVTEPKSGERHTFGPDDDVPSWAFPLITNPDAWVDGKLPAAAARAAKSESE